MNTLTFILVAIGTLFVLVVLDMIRIKINRVRWKKYRRKKDIERGIRVETEKSDVAELKLVEAVAPKHFEYELDEEDKLIDVLLKEEPVQFEGKSLYDEYEQFEFGHGYIKAFKDFEKRNPMRKVVRENTMTDWKSHIKRWEDSFATFEAMGAIAA